MDIVFVMFLFVFENGCKPLCSWGAGIMDLVGGNLSHISV